MQGDTDERSIAFAVKGTKVTASVLRTLMRKYLEHRNHTKNAHDSSHPYKGEQTLKQLSEQNAGLSNIEITDKNIGSFTRVAKKYGVDFALRKEKGSHPPKYYVFFKGRDTDAINSAFKEYANQKVRRASQPSIRKQIAKYQAAIKAQPPKAKTRNKSRSR